MRLYPELPAQRTRAILGDLVGALAAGDYEPLVRALFEDWGLKPPGRSPP